MAEPGVKYDGGKPPLSLLPAGPLAEVAHVLEHGASKYGMHNWRGGITWHRILSAMLRHIFAFIEGENNDPETGLSHIAHAVCNGLFLLEFQQTHTELDDRHDRHP